MTTCIRCQASIPAGRNYCTAHYMEALAEYENAMAEYHHNAEIWNSMSDGERAINHASAEDSSIGRYAGLTGLAVGGVVWYVSAQQRDIDVLWGIGILVVSFLIFTKINPVRIMLGRLTRLFLRAIGYFICLWIVGAIISNWSPYLKENAAMLTEGLAVAMLVISIIMEITGKHHASGAPSMNMPYKPSP